jgi:hypothetical protein
MRRNVGRAEQIAERSWILFFSAFLWLFLAWFDAAAGAQCNVRTALLGA